MIRAELRGDTGMDPGIFECTAEGITVRGGTPVIQLCRKLIGQGRASASPMQVFRGEVLALHIRSIGEAARLRVGKASTFRIAT